MASSSGYAVNDVVSELDNAIAEQQAITSAAHSEDTDLIDQTQVDQDDYMELSK